MNGNGEKSARMERAFGSLRASEWRGETPAMETLAMGGGARERRRRVQRVAVASVVLLLVGGVSYAGYRVVARSWEASIRAEGDRVEVMLNGQRVAPEAIEWLPDGTCMVTVNGARVLLDPKQPGGASATIRVEEAEDERE